MDKQEMELRHLRREARTALELAVVTLAPSDLMDRLAAIAGLLEAITELPANSPPVIALVPTLLPRARGALDEWREWYDEHQAARVPKT
jgi:hypothetical protein